MSSDPAFNMAAQLLGAMLNVQVGAGICPNFLTAIQEGQALLFNHSFNGNTYSAFSAAEATVANTLATYLDNYNNNKPCPASPPPLLP